MQIVIHKVTGKRYLVCCENEITVDVIDEGEDISNYSPEDCEYFDRNELIYV